MRIARLFQALAPILLVACSESANTGGGNGGASAGGATGGQPQAGSGFGGAATGGMAAAYLLGRHHGTRRRRIGWPGLASLRS